MTKDEGKASMSLNTEFGHLNTTSGRVATHGITVERGHAEEDWRAAEKLRAAADHLAVDPKMQEQQALELTLRFLLGVRIVNTYDIDLVNEAIRLTAEEVRKYAHSWGPLELTKVQLEPTKVWKLFTAHYEAEEKKAVVKKIIDKQDLRKGL